MVLESLFFKEVVILPELFLSISIIYLILHGTFVSVTNNYPIIQTSVSYLSILILSFVCILLSNEYISLLESIFLNYNIVNDYLSYIAKILISFSSIICLIMIQNYLLYQKLNSFEYIILILLSVLGILLLCSANDLITAYLTIELQSLSFYILASFKNSSTLSIGSGLKYFVLGSFASSLFLFGSSLLYFVVGSVNFEDFKDLFFWIYPGSSLLLSDLDSYYFLQNSNIALYSLNEKLNNFKNLPIYSRDLKLLYIELLNIDSLLYLTEEKKSEKIALYNNLIGSFKNYTDNINSYIGDLNWASAYYGTFFITADAKTKLLNIEILIKMLKEVGASNSKIPFTYEEVTTLKNFVKSIESVTFNTFENDYQDEMLYNTLFNTELIQIGLIFILVSLFFKLALAPFHLWSPDVYENSPTSSTAIFVLLPKLGLFVLIIRIYFYSCLGFLESWKFFLVSIAVLSIIIGSIVGIEQRKMKSLLAYSSISHMGYVLLSFSSGTFEGILTLFSYLIIYLLSNLCIWSIILLLRVKTNYFKKLNKDLTDFVSLNKTNSVLSFVISVCLLSIAGIPPMIGFFVKFGVFLSVIDSSMYFVSVIAIILSVISTFYYLRIIKVIYFEKMLVGKLYFPIESESVIFIISFFYLFLFLFIDPTMLYLISYKISSLIFVN